jgi:hypothetical protein
MCPECTIHRADGPPNPYTGNAHPQNLSDGPKPVQVSTAPPETTPPDTVAAYRV